MNDFTKEELVELSLTLKGYDFDNIDIIEKIQSLIDSYCEHPILEGNVTGYKCMGCQEMFNDSQ